MTTRSQSLYYADDKDIYDLLASAKLRMTDARLLELVRRRGLILSSFTKRSDLVDYISRITFDWEELEWLMEMLDSAERAPRETSSTLRGEIARPQVLEAAEILRTQRSNRDEAFRIVASDGNIIKIHVNYTELELSRTRLRQRVDRDLTIAIELQEGQLLVRHAATDRAKEIVNDLSNALISATSTGLVRSQIALTALSTAKRTEFFVELFRLAGHKVGDVSRVKVHRPADEADEALDDDLDDAPVKTEEKAFAGIVRKMTLDGSNVTTSRVYQDLIDSGHFMHRAIWQLEPESTTDPRVEVEAGFSNAAATTGFEYSVRHVWERKASGEFRKTPSAPDSETRLKYARLMLESAERAFETVATGPESSEAKSSKKSKKK